jgi:hypothetical protein
MKIGIARLLFLIITLSIVSLLAPASGFGQEAISPARLSLSEVVERLTERNAQRAADLAGYRSRRTYQLEYRGFPRGMQAELVVDLKYQAPNSEEFTVVSENGPKWMVNTVLKRLLETEQESISDKNRESVQITGQNYNFAFADATATSDSCSYVLNAEPKNPTKFLFRGKVWVDDRDFAICRIEAEPAKNPSFWIKKTEIHHAFERVGEFWLPAENVSVSHVRFDGRATLTIKYGEYEVQTAHAQNLTAPVRAD